MVSSALGREGQSEGLTILGEQVVGTTNDELVDLGTQLLERLVSLGLLQVGRIAIAAAKDGQLELFMEVLLGAEVAGIAEGEKRVVLVEVVLCGGRKREMLVSAAGRNQQRRTWMGVPVRMTRRLQLMALRAV
jgi:hypothetical protein